MFLDLPWKREKLSEMWNWPYVFWLNFFGLWPEEGATPTRLRYQRLMLVVSTGICLVTDLSIIMGVLKTVQDGEFTKNLFPAFEGGLAVGATFKYIQVGRHKESLRTAMRQLQELTDEIKDPEDVIVLKSKIYRMWVICLFNMTLTVFAIIHWTCRPIFILLVFNRKTTILKTWPAFNETWTQFVISFVLHSIATYPLGFGFSIFDNVYLCLCEYILAHMLLIKNNLKRLHLNGEKQDTIKIKILLKRHIKLLLACKELKYCSESVLTIQVIITTLTYCLGVFILTVSDQKDVNLLMNLTEAMILQTVFLYFLSSYSNNITLEFESLTTSIYESDMLDGSLSQKKTLIVMMTKAVQPVEFGGLIKINLNTIINVLKTAFSYYNFLIAVTETTN